MMELPFFQVDAFADVPLAGNPAAVLLLEAFLDDHTLLAIAQENNLSETAFLVPSAKASADFHLRWFTPALEVPLCGHATLASALVVFLKLKPHAQSVRFSTASGLLEVTRTETLNDRTCRLCLSGPAVVARPQMPSAAVLQALGLKEASEGLVCEDTVVVVEDAQAVASLAPDMAAIKRLSTEGVIVTAPASTRSEVDFVSRYFVPQAGIDEDPVTGYAHFLVGPYWARRLGKDRVCGRQVSARPGTVDCEMVRDATGAIERVRLTGAATLVIEGTAFFAPPAAS